jgi:methionyl-tRNA formyltransferase
MLKKKDGQLDFTLTAKELERKVRAFNPWPGALMPWKGGQLKIHNSRTAGFEEQQAITSTEPGIHTVYEGYPAVVTGKGILVLDQVQPAGKKPMPGEVFLRGARDWLSQ